MMTTSSHQPFMDVFSTFGTRESVWKGFASWLDNKVSFYGKKL